MPIGAVRFVNAAGMCFAALALRDWGMRRGISGSEGCIVVVLLLLVLTRVLISVGWSGEWLGGVDTGNIPSNAVSD